MLNQSFPDITAKITLWVGVLPAECERQADWTNEVNLAFEEGQGKPFYKDGFLLHFTSVPNVDEVGLGMKVMEFEATEVSILEISNFVSECAAAKAKFVPVLNTLLFRNAETIAKFFFTTELRSVPRK